MIESTACRVSQRPEIDLLPWADPYIAQLFQKAMLLESSGRAEVAAESLASREHCRSQMEVKVTPDRPSVAISRPLPRLAPRTRRTESGRSLVRC